MATSIESVEVYGIGEVQDRREYISWPAILAGNAVTGGLILVLIPLGAAAGLAMTSPYSAEGVSGTTIGIAAVAWLAFMYLFSTFAGAYVAGRLRPRSTTVLIDEVRFRDGMNGLVVWGVGMIISAVFTFMSVSAAVGTATQAVGQAAGGAMSGAAGVAGSILQQQNMPSLNTGYLADLFLRGSETATPQPNAAPARSEADVRAEIGRILAASAASGQVSDQDRAYLATLIAQRSGLSQEEARQRVDERLQRVKEARDQVVATTKETAEAARKAAAQGAFWTALMSLLAGVVAFYAARMGGEHRDEAQRATAGGVTSST